MHMKIFIDGHPLLSKKTGIGHYTNNLIKEFQIKEMSFKIVTNQTINKSRLNTLHNLNSEKYNLLNKLYPYKLIRRVFRPNYLYKLPIDLKVKESDKTKLIFHATNFITLPTKFAKQIVTIHDLAFMEFPKVVEKSTYKYMMRWVPYSINKADQIIVDSKHTKSDIMKFFNVPKEKINIVYLAADKLFEKQSKYQIKFVRDKYNIPKDYLLYIGTLEPRKNLVTLVDIFNTLKKKYLIKEKLVIVGAKGWKFNPIFEKVQKLQLENDIIFMGYIVDEDLPAIYSGASVFTFPSLYEGFGIPLLEAMQCEVPVIASNTSSIPEVVGAAGILIDPYDIEEWADNIYRVLTNKVLYENLVTKGKQQASKFSWEKVASETLAVYEKALKGG